VSQASHDLSAEKIVMTQKPPDLQWLVVGAMAELALDLIKHHFHENSALCNLSLGLIGHLSS